MKAKGVKQAAELRNVKVISTFDDSAIQTIHGGSNTFNFQFGIVAESGTSVGNLSVGSEGSIVIQHNSGGASVSAAVYIGGVVERNLGTQGGEGHLSSHVKFG